MSPRRGHVVGCLLYCVLWFHAHWRTHLPFTWTVQAVHVGTTGCGGGLTRSTICHLIVLTSFEDGPIWCGRHNHSREDGSDRVPSNGFTWILGPQRPAARSSLPLPRWLAPVTPTANQSTQLSPCTEGHQHYRHLGSQF